jgi:hypothetical protein
LHGRIGLWCQRDRQTLEYRDFRSTGKISFATRSNHYFGRHAPQGQRQRPAMLASFSGLMCGPDSAKSRSRSKTVLGDIYPLNNTGQTAGVVQAIHHAVEPDEVFNGWVARI